MHSIQIVLHIKEDLSKVTDLQVSKYRLIKHLGIESLMFSLDASTKYKDQLLPKKGSDLETGCVPLYVCDCCADLGCGCVSIKVEFINDQYIWSEFAFENNFEEGRTQGKYMNGFGPFVFDKTEYENIVHSIS